MLEFGLVDEVKTLIKQGAKKDSQPMKAIGYKEVVEFLEERIDYKTMLTKLLCLFFSKSSNFKSTY